MTLSTCISPKNELCPRVFFLNFEMSFVGKTNRFLCLVSLQMEVRKHLGPKSVGKD